METGQNKQGYVNDEKTVLQKLYFVPDETDFLTN